MSQVNFKDFYSETTSCHTQHVDIKFSPSIRKYLQSQCNNDRVLYTNMPEVAHVERFFGPEPMKAMEIGGGVGRGTVYIAKRFGFGNTKFYMLDGNSGDKQIAPIDGEGDQDFYNSFEATKTFCNDNGIDEDRLVMLDAATEWEKQIEGEKMDLIYSFLSIGFHWSIELYLERLKPFCHKDTILMFGMRGTDRGNEFAVKQAKLVEADPFYKIVTNVRESELYRSSVLVIGVNGE